MIARARRAALLIDFDNVKSRRLAELAADVVAVLQRPARSGAERPRRFIAKTVYWNLREDGARQAKIDAFRACGFAFKATNSVVDEKSTADTVIAFDLGDLMHRRPPVEEFILLSSDSDFLPVLERLRDDERAVTVYARRADTSEAYWNGEIAMQDLDALIARAEARADERRDRARRLAAAIAAPGRMARAALRRVGRLARGQSGPPDRFASVAELADLVVEHMRAEGVRELDIAALARFLGRFSDFETQGPADRVWFGFGSHRALMRALVGARHDLRVMRGPRRGRRRTLKLARPRS